jgi:GTP-binding protein LepA
MLQLNFAIDVSGRRVLVSFVCYDPLVSDLARVLLDLSLSYPRSRNNSCLNLIDTPGHVDFSYEVSRSLAACEGALLVVDASQGIEAQTLANVYLALENNLEIIPVLNKIDLPAADPERVAEEIEQTIGLDCSDIVHASAKAGIGIEQILERIVKHVPPPPAATGGPFRALIFDSYYDAYRGVVVFFRVVDGQVSTGDKVRFLASDAEHEVTQVGIMQPNQVPVDTLRAGEVGYIWGNIKDVMDATVGDTIVLASEFKRRKAEGRDPPIEALPGYAKSVPMVYCGLFPVDADQYESLRDALGKLRLNDAALSYEPENSGAMGFGFRCVSEFSRKIFVFVRRF